MNSIFDITPIALGEDPKTEADLIREIPTTIFSATKLLSELKTSSIPGTAAIHLVNLEKSIAILQKYLNLLPRGLKSLD